MSSTCEAFYMTTHSVVVFFFLVSFVGNLGSIVDFGSAWITPALQPTIIQLLVVVGWGWLTVALYSDDRVAGSWSISFWQLSHGLVYITIFEDFGSLFSCCPSAANCLACFPSRRKRGSCTSPSSLVVSRLHRGEIVTKPYLVSKEAQLYSL